MDFCKACGVAVDVAWENGKTVYLCRNPACEQCGKRLEESKEEKRDV